MRRMTLTTLGLLGLMTASPAMAADIPAPYYKAPPPVYAPAFYNWTGFYIGGHVGYGWADFSGQDPVTGAPTGSLNADGFLYGGQIGFNYQLGSWVLGIEGDASFGDIKYSQDLGGGDRAEIELEHIFTVAGRVGYAFDRWMIYAKGGGAWTQEKYNFVVLGNTATGTVDRSGWLVGAGVEWAFAGNWSAKLEYNYMDFGSKLVTLTTTGGLVAAPANVDLTVQTVKLGVNYKFGWGQY